MVTDVDEKGKEKDGSSANKTGAHTPSTEPNSSDESTKNIFPVYKAKYSGVDVYELAHPTGSVMKRKQDNWVNATHILKAAKFAKAKRTRILEKDVMGKVHEKIQGGFGKYQGTWVPMDVAEELSVRYDVYDELKNLLEYSVKEGGAEPELAPKHTHAVKKDSKNSSLKEASAAKKKKSVSEKLKKEKSGVVIPINAASAGSAYEYKKDISSANSINNNSTGLRAFLPDENYLSNSNLFSLGTKRSFTEMDNSDSRGGTASKHTKPVKLQRSNTNKNSLMVAEPHHFSSGLNSPISNHNMLPYLSSSAGANNGVQSQMPLQATRTNSIKLPSLVAAANVALSPNFSGNNGIKLKPNSQSQTYSPSQSQNFGHLFRPATRMNSFNNNNGISLKYISGNQTMNDDINMNNNGNNNGLLPSLSTLSSQKRNITYSPPVFNKPYLSNTPSFLQTPRVTNSGNAPKASTANYRQTPLKLDDGLSSDIEPMTPFFNSKQALHQRQNSIDLATKLTSNTIFPMKYENVLVQELIQSILTNEKVDLEKIINDTQFEQFQSFKIVNSPIDSMGNTLLHLACGTGSVEIVDLILNNCEVNPYQINKRGESCVMQAFIFKNCNEKKSLIQVIELFGEEKWKQIVRIRDAKGENLMHLTIRFCQRYKSGNEYLKLLIDKLEPELVKELLMEQSYENGDTPLHLCQEFKDFDNFQMIVEKLKVKFENNFHLYNGFLNNYLYTIKNKNGVTCQNEGYAVEQHGDKEENAYYLKGFAKINCEIIPTVQLHLMDLLNKRQQKYCLNNSKIKMAQQELKMLNSEIMKLNKYNNEIDEMKFMLELNNLHNEICIKKLENIEEMSLNKPKSIVSDINTKLSKLKELKIMLNEKHKVSVQCYKENRDVENTMIDNCKKLVSKYMEVEIENINENMIDTMIKDLDKD